MSDTPLYDALAEQHGEPDPSEPEYLKQVESLPDDGEPETMDDFADQSGDPELDGNDTPNGGI